MEREHPPIRTVRRRAARGLTLVELLVAMALGLVIVAAVTAAFVNGNATRREVELSSDVIENGRYALDLLGRELSQTGFYGTLATPTGGSIDLCATAPAAWADSLAVAAVGLNNAQADPACLARKAGTDAIFIQRASTCTTAEAGAGCAEEAASTYLQVSECGAEYSASPFVVARGFEPALALQTRACDGTPAAKRKLVRRIFYIGPDDVLNYVDITPAGVSAPVPLVENIEQMQVEYGIDSSGDGTPDSFAPVPADWSQVIGARIWVLARSATASSNARNALVFRMSDTTVEVPAAGMNLKRRVHSTYITFLTPKARRES